MMNIILLLIYPIQICAVVTVYETFYVTKTIYIDFQTPESTPTIIPGLPTAGDEVLYSGAGLGTYYFDITGLRDYNLICRSNMPSRRI
jgi:hypothetical protein